MTTDVAIIGAGCAGRSVAWQLLEHGLEGLRVVVLDPRTRFARDRTWCSWRVEPHPFQRLATHVWDAWELRRGDRVLRRRSERHPYEHLPADAFYRATSARLEESGYELSLGERVQGVFLGDRGVSVVTERRLIRAGLVLDSRPAAGEQGFERREARLVQHFAGHFVAADEPVFDASAITLMDFEPPRGREVRFTYVLPFDERRALVESTGISPRPVGAEEHDARTRRYLARRFPGVRFEVTGRETGCIPMDVRAGRPRFDERLVAIGLAGGCARPSTGYAFCAIQRQARAIAEALRDGRPLPARPPRPRRAAFLDCIFLSLARRRPELVPEVLLSLFERSEPDRLVRFLSDAGSLRDDLHAVFRMPAAPMLREAGAMAARAW